MMNMDATPTTIEYTNDRLRRIHWWIRLFGVLWLASIILAMGGFFAVMSYSVTERAVNRPAAAHYASYMECLEAPKTTMAECQAEFGR